MMKYKTKKDRAKVYRKALENLNKHYETTGGGVCAYIGEVAFEKRSAFDRVTTKTFPEFLLFKNKQPEDMGLFWFERNNLEIRQTALLLAAEMCN